MKNKTKIKPGKFFGSVMKHSKELRVGNIGDAEEFFMHLEDKLEDENKCSVMREIFYTRVAEVYFCMRCGFKLRVPKTEILYLPKGCVREKLTELTGARECDAQRTCDRCRAKRDFVEMTVVESPPHVLQISLKSGYGARDDACEFPEFLNIKNHMEVPSASDVVYRLYAVVRSEFFFF